MTKPDQNEVKLKQKTSWKVYPALALLFLFTVIAWGQSLAPQVPALPESTAQAVPDSLYNEDGVLKVLPAYTDSLWAWQNRSPRNINQGYYIIIQKSTRKLHFYKDGILVKSYPVAVGKNPKDKTRENDMATPEGHYHIRSIHDSITWRYTSPITGSVSGPGVYGPWFLAVNTLNGSFSGESWTGIGIHGTSSPSSIGKYVSHGCIRLYSKDVTELKEEVAWLSDPSQIRVDILN